jgi:hypothetical protein
MLYGERQALAPCPLVDCFVTTLLGMTEWMIPLQFIAR